MRVMGKVNPFEPVGSVRRGRLELRRRARAQQQGALDRRASGSSRRCSATARSIPRASGMRRTASTSTSLTTWSHHWQSANGITNGGPDITLPRLPRSPGTANIPRYRNQNTYTIHDDFTLSYDAKGHHDLKAGGEYLHLLDNTRNCNQCGGLITASGGIPSAGNRCLLLFPDQFNADTWQLADPSIGADRDQLPGRHLRLQSHFLTPVRMWKLRRVGAGRLEDLAETDAEPRRPLRPDLERVCAERRLPAVRDAGPARRTPTTIQPRLGFAYYADG